MDSGIFETVGRKPGDDQLHRLAIYVGPMWVVRIRCWLGATWTQYDRAMRAETGWRRRALGKISRTQGDDWGGASE
jgi:hypothetical protein